MIARAVRLYLGFALSSLDVKELLAECGVPVSYSDPFGLCPPEEGGEKCTLGDMIGDAARAQGRALFNAVGDFGNSVREGLVSAGAWALREGATQIAIGLATNGAGNAVGTGLRSASPALRGLFAEGSVAGKSIIGLRSQLLEGGFKQTLSEKGIGYLFRNGTGEEVRIMRRAGGWDLRARNAAGNYLDELGNVAGPSRAHGIRVNNR